MQAFLPTRDLSRRWTRRRRFVCRILLLVCAGLGSALRSRPEVTPSDVEAAYLYNFGKFVRWPAGALQDSEPFALCILGEDGFGETLDSLIANETLQGHKIVARRLSSVAAANNCQIVFLGQSEEPRLIKDLAALQKKPILTISSLPAFLERGGMIQFLLQNNRVRFAVNLSAAEQTGLALSSELLKVAVYVGSKPSEAK